MSNIVECKDKDLLNTGALDQCHLGVTTKYVVSPDLDFGFETLEDLKDKTEWVEAVAAKDLYPLYEAEEITNANTDPQFYEGRRINYKQSEGKKVKTFRSIVSLCSYRALKRFDGKIVRVFELTEDRGVRAVQHETKFKGQKTMIYVGLLEDPSNDSGIQSTVVTINYIDEAEYTENGVNAFLDGWGDQELIGILDVKLELVSCSATSVKFKILSLCGNKPLKLFESGDVKMKDDTGADETTSFVAPDTDGIYELTGTGFENGFTVNLNGVVTKGGYSYESTGAITLAGIPS